MATKKKSKAGKKKAGTKNAAARGAAGKRRPKKVSKPTRKPTRKAPAKRPTAAVRSGAGDAMRALARRIVAVSVANDDGAIFGLYAPNVVSREVNMPATSGLDALRQKFEGWRDMVTSSKFTAERVWVDGNTIVIEWIGDVTLAGSGKQAQLREIAIHEIENGKIARERYYYDPAALQP